MLDIPLAVGGAEISSFVIDGVDWVFAGNVQFFPKTICWVYPWLLKAFLILHRLSLMESVECSMKMYDFSKNELLDRPLAIGGITGISLFVTDGVGGVLDEDV